MPKFAKEQALRTPDSPAMIDPYKTLTWEQVDEIINRAANIILQTDLGEKRRIAVFAARFIISSTCSHVSVL